MSEKKKPDSTGSATPAPGAIDTKLEVVVIPVSDVDQAKAFYESLGWRLDVDRVEGEFRVIQFTPTGSSCSIQFGANLTPAEPGSSRALLLIVSDIDAAHDDLVGRGVKVGNVFHCATGSVCRFRDAGADDRASGPAPAHNSYGSFASFSDPAGNGWGLPGGTNRPPGRTDPALAAFGSTPDLAGALRRAAAAHGEHEKRI